MLSHLQFDYTFQLDGTIEVRLSASGYLQGGYWTPESNAYGGKIGITSSKSFRFSYRSSRFDECIVGNLHDHVINFKYVLSHSHLYSVYSHSLCRRVDLDVAGTSNSLLRTTTSQESVPRPWLSPDEPDDPWGAEVIQQRITKTFIENEDDAKLVWPGNLQGGFAIVNRDEKNRWGYERGYAIISGVNSIHNVSRCVLHSVPRTDISPRLSWDPNASSTMPTGPAITLR
jgi:primary-amine oxidase